MFVVKAHSKAIFDAAAHELVVPNDHGTHVRWQLAVGNLYAIKDLYTAIGSYRMITYVSTEHGQVRLLDYDQYAAARDAKWPQA